SISVAIILRRNITFSHLIAFADSYTLSLHDALPISFFMTLRDGLVYGVFFDNTFRTVFDMKTHDDMYSFEAEGGQLDYYVMAGSGPKSVLRKYTNLEGRMPPSAKWGLGFPQSR